jgi:hypothetical protein
MRVVRALFHFSQDPGIALSLWPLIDAIRASGLEFSIIRKANAQPRLASM